MYAFTMLLVSSLKMLVRDRAALVGTVAMPLLFVLTFSLFDLDIAGTTFTSSGGVPYFDFVFPGLLALGLMNFTMAGIATSTARYRELGVLHRLQATPLRPGVFVVAQVVARLVLACVQLAVMAALGVALGADVAGSWTVLLVLAVGGNLVFLGLGLAIAGRTRTVEAATNLAGIATAPLMFISGMFFPVESMPAWSQELAEVLPITPLIEAMRAVALDGATLSQLGGEGLALLVWVPASLLLARLSFHFSSASS